MNIYTNAKYAVDLDGTTNCAVWVTLDSQLMFVPMDPSNSHYAEILKQVADGTITIADAD
tara:strand:+ start:186 stop:365 length:180 start_codon:yes stop_codon:yes gene_type:complete